MAKCTQTTKGGKPCRASAMVGAKICIFHATQQSSKRMTRSYGKAMREYRRRK